MSNRDSESCDRQEIEISEALGEFLSAWSLAKRLFTASPSYKEYLALCQLKRRGDIDDPTFLSFVEQALKAAYEPPHGLYVSVRSDDLLRFYIKRKRLETALSYYSRVVCATIERTNNGAYEQALRYLQSLEKRLAYSPEMTGRFNAEVYRIAQLYKRKRNMFALFKQHYAHCL